MPNIIKNNYKKILLIIPILLVLIISPIIVEIIFKSGNIVGTIIRYYATNGICF